MEGNSTFPPAALFSVLSATRNTARTCCRLAGLFRGPTFPPETSPCCRTYEDLTLDLRAGLGHLSCCL
jgi:hypothetical protein